MESWTDTVAPEIWDLVHTLKLPMRKVAARYDLPLSEVREMLAQEKLRRELEALKRPLQMPCAPRIRSKKAEES
jgi:hypothetical protein